MPNFRTIQTKSLSDAMRDLAARRGGLGLDPLAEAKIDSMAADDAHRLALVDKVRMEAEALRNRERLAADPGARTEYASDTAGLTIPQGTALYRRSRGETDPYEDAAGNVDLQPPSVPGTVTPGQEGLFRAALAALSGNRMATGDTNASQLAEAAKRAQEARFAASASETEGVPDANRLLSAAGLRTREPFAQGGRGQILNQESGAVTQTPASEALSAQARASAEASKARAASGGGARGSSTSPYQVRRWIDLTAEREYKAQLAAYEALSYSERKAAQRPTLENVRQQVEARYQQVGAQAMPSPFKDFPDAKFDPKMGQWVVIRGGKRYAVEE